MFELVTSETIGIAAEIHSISWKDSHKSFCSEQFVKAHTVERQKQYIQSEMNCGKKFYILVENGPKGIVSVKANMIENLYVLPEEQRKGYGTQLLQYAETLCRGTPTLWVRSNNDKAISLYMKSGYQFSGNSHFLSTEVQELEMQHASLIFSDLKKEDEK